MNFYPDIFRILKVGSGSRSGDKILTTGKNTRSLSNDQKRADNNKKQNSYLELYLFQEDEDVYELVLEVSRRSENTVLYHVMHATNDNKTALHCLMVE